MEKIIDFRKDGDAGYFDSWDVFFGGNSLFCYYLSGSEPLRDLDFKFGIVPVPKLDENQENYRAFSCCGMVVVSANLTNPDMTGAVIEALFATAHKYIPESIVERYIEGKLLDSEDDVEMFRILNSNDVRKYDFTRNYDASDGVIQNFALIYSLIKDQSMDIMSRWETVRPSVTNAFDKLYQTVAEQN